MGEPIRSEEEVDAVVAASTHLLSLKGVMGIGRGATEGGMPCLVVMTVGETTHLLDDIGPTVDGVPVVFQDLGEAPVALSDAPLATRDIEPDCG